MVAFARIRRRRAQPELHYILSSRTFPHSLLDRCVQHRASAPSTHRIAAVSSPSIPLPRRGRRRRRVPGDRPQKVGWSATMARLYVGNLDPRVTARELEDEFRVFGVLRSVWVARKPPGFAFIDFDDRRDAQDAIRDLDGKNGWRVELSRNASSSRGGRDKHGGSEMKCYECGETGHFARECRLRIGAGGLGSGRRRSRSRSRSRSPRYRRSPSYGRRSYSPQERSPRRRSVSPARGRSYSRSP